MPKVDTAEVEQALAEDAVQLVPADDVPEVSPPGPLPVPPPPQPGIAATQVDLALLTAAYQVASIRGALQASVGASVHIARAYKAANVLYKELLASAAEDHAGD